MKAMSGIAGTALALLIVGAALAPANQGGAAPANVPQYTADGQLKFPENYGEWVYLSSGIDMSYRPDLNMGHSMFDNVFVNPEAYKYSWRMGLGRTKRCWCWRCAARQRRPRSTRRDITKRQS